MDYKGSHELTLDVPATLFSNQHIFSVDFGGSVIKLAYTSVHDDTLTLHFSSHSLKHRHEALMFLKEKVQSFVKSGDVVHMCGLGCNVHRDELVGLLNVSIVNISEVDCLADGFRFLARHFPISEIVHPTSDLVVEHGEKLSRGYAAAFNGWNTSGRMRPWKYNFTSRSTEVTSESKENNPASQKDTSVAEACQDEWRVARATRREQIKIDHITTATVDDDRVQYPAIVVQCGSAAAVDLVYEDGTYLPLAVTPTSGLTFLALGSLFTGVKSYEELVALAERGTVDNVNNLFSELGLSGGDNDSYTAFTTFEHTIFTLGQAALKDTGEFKKEDLAAAALYVVVDNLASMAQTWSMYTGINKVYFCGGFPSSSPYIRHELTKELAFKSRANPFGFQTDHMVIKLGAYLSVLGALIKNGES